jgi:hypothetical protein
MFSLEKFKELSYIIGLKDTIDVERFIGNIHPETGVWR